MHDRRTPYGQINGHVKGEIKDNIQDSASGNLMDDNAGVRAHRKKDKFWWGDKINFGHVKFMVPEDHSRDVLTWNYGSEAL